MAQSQYHNNETDHRIADEHEKKAQAYMRRAVTQLMARHGLSETVAASLMLTVTEVVSLGPKSAR